MGQINSASCGQKTRTGGTGFGAEALSNEIEHCRGRFARHVVLLDDLVDTEVSRFSMTVATGKRVPLNTHAPLTLPWMLSTVGHPGPVKRCHECNSYVSDYGNGMGVTALKRGAHALNLPQPTSHPVPTRENAAQILFLAPWCAASSLRRGER
jgi:hypothetical protein